MKVLIYLGAIVCFVSFACINSNSNNNKQAIETAGTYLSKNKIEKDTLCQTDSIKALLNGVWAENVDENALFEIINDSLYYLEDFENPVGIEIQKNAFVIKGSVPVKCEILKLTTDSLWYIDEFNDDTTKLYKR